MLSTICIMESMDMKVTIKKRHKLILLFTVITLLISSTAYAHNGSLDKNQGHHDKKNVSGLGDYHFHCGDTEAHLHPNGICPFSDDVTQPTDITIDNTESTMLKGDTRDAKVTVLPEDAFEMPIKWLSNNEEVIKIEEDRIVAVNVGEALISATTYNGKIASLNIEVLPSVEQIIVDKSDLTIKAGESIRVNAHVYPANAVNSKLVWSTQDINVATVKKGVITAQGGGNVTISAISSNDIKTSISVKVIEQIQSINICDDSIHINVGESHSVFYTTTPATASGENITWMSSNPEVAYIQNGNVIGNKNGSCTITITANNGVSSSVNVRVGMSPLLAFVLIATMGAILYFTIKTKFKGRKQLKREGYYRNDYGSDNEY